MSEPIHGTAGPVNLNRVGFLTLPQSEVESQVIAGEEAAASANAIMLG